jgi:hypothetical protein
MNLIKEVSNLYNESYETLIKENEKATKVGRHPILIHWKNWYY